MSNLVEIARAAALKAYAPYSGFSVGCAIESCDGRIVTGANMENACYRLGLCAEQSALTQALGANRRRPPVPPPSTYGPGRRRKWG